MTKKIVPKRRRLLSPYEVGSTTVFASSYDQRISYALYVPPSTVDSATLPKRIVAVIHGTSRNFLGYRDAFARYAESNDSIVLAPLFPAGLIDPRDLGNYRQIAYRGIRFDEILLSIVDEVSEKYAVSEERIFLHGFSGGGHFAHRFYYLHPRRLGAVSIAAPGWVTLLDPEIPWWVGLKGVEEIFGQSIDFDALTDVPVHMVVGAEDVDISEFSLRPGHPLWRDEVSLLGNNRVERLAALRDSFIRQGITVRHETVRGIRHDGWKLIPSAEAFFHDAEREYERRSIRSA